MTKEHFIAAHEALVSEYLDAYPDASWDEAYDATADGAWDRMRDTIASRIDEQRARMKDEGLAAPTPFRSAEDARSFAQAIIDLGKRRNAEIQRDRDYEAWIDEQEAKSGNHSG